MRNVLLLVSLIFNVYLGYKLWTVEPKIKYVSEKRESSDVRKVQEDSVQVKNAALKKNEIKEEIKEKVKEKIQKEEVISPEEKSLLVQEEFDSLQRDFHRAFEEFTFDELRLSESQVLFYHDLKNERQKEIHDYLAPKWEELKKRGEDTSYYVYSSEDLIFVGKINDKYLSSLRREWGEDAFERYQNFLSEYNNAQISNGNDIKFMIDF